MSDKKNNDLWKMLMQQGPTDEAAMQAAQAPERSLELNAYQLAPTGPGLVPSRARITQFNEKTKTRDTVIVNNYLVCPSCGRTWKAEGKASQLFTYLECVHLVCCKACAEDPNIGISYCMRCNRRACMRCLHTFRDETGPYSFLYGWRLCKPCADEMVKQYG